MLVQNWKILFLSYNYAYFYGLMLPKLDQPLYQFIMVSFLQRFMCAVVMNNIHKRTSQFVHAGYYLLYYFGGIIYLKSYYKMVIMSLCTSLIWIYSKGKQLNYNWDKQYVDNILSNISHKNAFNINYKQAYSRFEVYHLYIILCVNIIYHNYYFFIFK